MYPIVAQLERAAGLRRDDTPEGKLEKLEVLLRRHRLRRKMWLCSPNFWRFRDPIATRRRTSRRSASGRGCSKPCVGQFVALARQQPLLMVFEDAHWIDPTSRELLDIVVAQIANLPMMLLITFRPEFEPSSWTGRPHVTPLGVAAVG